MGLRCSVSTAGALALLSCPCGAEAGAAVSSTASGANADALGSAPTGGAVSGAALAFAERVAEALARKRAASAQRDHELRSRDVTEPLKAAAYVGGGGRCELDVECGYFNPEQTASKRRELPSGNGARCLVGRCICATSSLSHYGCPRCTAQLRPTFSYSDEGVEISTHVRGADGRLVDLCDFPVGGAPCRVGLCVRDGDGLIVECPGDFECDAAGSGGGICVGDDDTIGFCVCGSRFFCKDCSLHERDVLAGAVCDRYITGGARCASDEHCGPDVAGFCALPKWHSRERGRESLFGRAANLLDHVASEHRPFCKCEPGWTCRRCDKTVAELEQGGVGCNCDAPSMRPYGGVFETSRLEVELIAPPWDSAVECRVLYAVQRLDEVPTAPRYSPTRRSAEDLIDNGLELLLAEDGSERPLVLEYDWGLAHQRGADKKGRLPPQLFLVFAVAAPRANLTLLMNASRLVASEVFVLNAAPRARSWALALVASVLAWRAPLGAAAAS